MDELEREDDLTLRREIDGNVYLLCINCESFFPSSWIPGKGACNLGNGLVFCGEVCRKEFSNG